MKQLTLIAALMSLILIGCGGSDSKKGFNTRSNFGAQGVDQFGNPINSASTCSGQSGPWSGSIYTNSMYNNDYVMAVSAFLSAIDSPSALNLGQIDGTCGSETGIAFQGKIDTLNGFDPRSPNMGYVEIDSASRVSLAIIDSTALNDPSTPVISIDAFNGADGYINNGYIEVEFYWANGVIQFVGEIDYNKQVVVGRAGFDNYVHYDNGDGEFGIFGDFEIPLCDLFVCN